MARAIITFKLMPESPEINLDPIKKKAQEIAIRSGAWGETKVKEEPIAFGLKAVLIFGMFTVENSDFEKIAEEMSRIDGVQSAEVDKMDLALG